MLRKYFSLRWILLSTGIIAIVGLTGMNVFSLYKLHQTTIESDVENRKLQISEFTDKVHYRFFAPYGGLSKLDVDHIQQQYEETGHFPEELLKLLDKASADSIYNGIYFKTQHSNACQEKSELLAYVREAREFKPASNYPESVCDGMGIARTRMKVLIDGYQYNNKVIFDTHQSITIALVNLSGQSVFGYLTMPIDQQYLVNNYLQEALMEKFGNSDTSGLIVWLRDWTKDQTVAGSDPSRTFEEDKVTYYQRFPGFFDNWTIKVAFTESPTIAASKASLVKNFIVLGVAFSLLLGALVFIFITAQKERALAQRQAGFLANVTHELKTPLAVMQAAGENLADGRVNNRERLQAYGRHIHSEALRLKRMIEKLLDVAKADAGQSLIEPKPVQLEQLLKEYIKGHYSFIETQGFILKTSVEKPLPPVMIDTDSFDTIIGNLIENAIKYSHKNKYLVIKLYRKGRGIFLEIIDRGIGIPKKFIGHIFEKFYRVEDSLTAKNKGHGLGLSIVKNLVELNGGEIHVHSEEGKGSQFIVEFPVLVDPQMDLEPNEFSASNNQLQDSPQYAG